MEKWNGSFVPDMQKSIGQTTFIPLNKMSPADWRLLDWDFLSNIAKNRIVAMALKGKIAGFVHYKFVSKGSARGGYLYPIMVGDMDDLEDLMAKPEFKNYGDADKNLTDAARRFDAALGRITAAILGATALLVLANKMQQAENEETTGNEFDEDSDIAQPDVNQIEDPKTSDELYLNQLVNGDYMDYTELDILLTWALGVLHDAGATNQQRLEWLEEWAQEAEQILGDADDKGLL